MTDKKTNPLLDIIKVWDYLPLITIIFVVLAIVGALAGSKAFAVLMVFMILGIITRMPAARSPFDLSTVKVSAVLLTFIDFRIAAIFAILTWWIARQWSPMEEMTNTIKWSLSVALPALIAPLFIGWAHNNLVTYTIHFTLVRFVFLIVVLSPIFRPATFFNDAMVDVTEFFFSIIYNSVLAMILGPIIFSYVGVTGWNIGGLAQVIGFFTGHWGY